MNKSNDLADTIACDAAYESSAVGSVSSSLRFDLMCSVSLMHGRDSYRDEVASFLYLPGIGNELTPRLADYSVIVVTAILEAAGKLAGYD